MVLDGIDIIVFIEAIVFIETIEGIDDSEIKTV